MAQDNSASASATNDRDVDPKQTPIAALGPEARKILSAMLNDCSILPADNGLVKDWRGLAELANVQECDILPAEADPTGRVLVLWAKNNKETCNVATLQLYLQQLERWDVYDDMKEIFESDCKRFLELRDSAERQATEVDIEKDQQILTRDDQYRLAQGLDIQRYDAFVLFADDDIDFATKLITTLEKDYNLKLCVKERDLICGLPFEHDAIMRIISERCNRLIIIVTNAFLQSAALQFFYKFARALGIEQQYRKIIPCRLEPCKIPDQLMFYTMLDYQRVNTPYYRFWEKLHEAIVPPPPLPNDICGRRSKNNSLRIPNGQSVRMQRPKSASYDPNSPIADGAISPARSTHSVASQHHVNFANAESMPNVNASNDTKEVQALVEHHHKKSSLNWLKKLFTHKKPADVDGSLHANILKKSWRKKLAAMH